MRIQNNSLNTQRPYSEVFGGLNKTAEKLSGGYRKHRAGDAAEGLAVSDTLRAQILGLQVLPQETRDAVYIAQTAEGTLQKNHNILQSMRELAVRSASENENLDRAALHKGFTQLRDELKEFAPKSPLHRSEIDSRFGAMDAVGHIDNALSAVSNRRAAMGRLEYKNSKETLMAGSRITDGNMAKKMAKDAKESILREEAKALHAQANSKPENVLKLLG